MTCEEVLEILNSTTWIKTKRNLEMISLCKKCIERQIPKKSIIIKEGKAWVKVDCPSCNAGLRPFQAFCDCCGQAINWSEV